MFSFESLHLLYLLVVSDVEGKGKCNIIISVFFIFYNKTALQHQLQGVQTKETNKLSLFIHIHIYIAIPKTTTTCNSIYSIYTGLCIYMYGMGNIITKFILTPNEQLCNNNNMCNILIHPTKIAKTIKRRLQCVLYLRIKYVGVSPVPLIFSNLFMQILIDLYLG